MQKRDDSLRSLGLTMVAVDKPLRADIKAMAAQRGITMAEYLREKVAEDKRANPQGVLSSISTVGPATNKQVEELNKKLDAVLLWTFPGIVPGGDKTKTVSYAIEHAVEGVVNRILEQRESKKVAPVDNSQLSLEPN